MHDRFYSTEFNISSEYNYFADCSAECPYKHAVRGTYPWGASEDHDNMHNWCSCERCGSQAYCTEGNLMQSNYPNAFLKAWNKE